MTVQAHDDTIDCFDVLFGSATRGTSWWLRTDGGSRAVLPIGRWLGGSYASEVDRAGDEALTDACRGRTIDLACGPGRFVRALSDRGMHAVGIDNSTVAVGLARRRGAIAVHGNIFEPMPGEGSWETAILADGNIGIGGDPEVVLRRARDMVCDGGILLIEVDCPGTGHVRERLRIENDSVVGEWYDWARIDAAHLATMGTRIGLSLDRVVTEGDRYFAHMTRVAVELPEPARVTSSCTSGD